MSAIKTETTILTSFQKVIQFMEAFGQSVHTAPQPILLKEDQKLTNLRVGLIKEEDKETIDALNNNDFIELVDGLGDIEYVVNGTGAAFGIDLDKEFQSIHETNMKELGYTVCENNTNGKKKTNFQKYIEYAIASNKYIDILKSSNLYVSNNDDFRPVTYTEPKDRSILLQSQSLIKDSRKKHMQLLESDLEKYASTYQFIKFGDTLINMLYCIYETAYIFGIDLDEAFRIIHDSNMTKLCNTEKEAKETVEWYLKNELRYKEPCYRRSNDSKYWIVYDKITGKVLKSINYTPADLKKFNFF